MVCSLSGKKTFIEFIEEQELRSVLDKSLTVTDETLRDICHGMFDPVCVLPPGEQAKHLDAVQTVVDALLEREASRDDTLCAFGGGVICDLTAFCGSIYMRGMNLILVPTTLLAMVDASVGGKTGVDYRKYKNLLGSFYPALRVLIYPEVLSTLSDHAYMNGLAEVIKHAFLAGGELFEIVTEKRKEILSRDIGILRKLIELSLKVKIEIVEQDPEELLGIRQQLNFGHTFAHALETSTDFSLSHGEAVAWGMAKAFQAGREIGITRPEYAESGISLLKSYGYPVDLAVDRRQEFFSSLKHDKKKRGIVIPFILQKSLADTILYPLELTALEHMI